MNYTLSDKLMAYMTLITGLVISAVAIWYSVAGLAAIFAAAVMPIIIMGVVLEISKLVATVWLKWNWNRAPWHIKSYLISAIAILMLITSMGIFGFLSKAHLDQAVPVGDVASKVALLDERINNERETITNARTLLGQLDKAVADISATPDREVNGRTISSAERALQVRKQQARDRANLTKTIEEAQARIVKLQEEKAPIASQLRSVEAEVGPIKYVAALIYGDNPDANLLEKAVRWVIIIIVLVFDPLAVALLLASQYSFQWFRQQDKENIKDSDNESKEFFDNAREIAKKLDNESANDSRQEKNDPSPVGWMFPKHANITDYNIEDKIDDEVIKEIEIDEDQEILESAIETEKQAMQAWKHDNPNSSLKLQKKLLEKGAIEELPWMSYLQPKADYTEEQEAALEAAKWAQEQLENRNEVTWMENENGQQVKKSTYQQNAEQNERTIWQRIQDAKK